jgi:hypothetical protein
MINCYYRAGVGFGLTQPHRQIWVLGVGLRFALPNRQIWSWPVNCQLLTINYC